MTTELKFSGQLLADIYLGKVTKWNDAGDCEAEPRRQAARDRHHGGASLGRIRNDLHLGRLPVEGVTRMEEQGRRRSTSPNWPTGVGGKGNEGVSGLVTQTPGSIGYVELIYALQNKISFGSVQNAAGEFVKGSVAGRDDGGGRRRSEHAGRLPCVDHERAWQGRVSDLFVHVAAALREPEGQGAEQDDGRLPEVGARGRSEILRRSAATRRCPPA